MKSLLVDGDGSLQFSYVEMHDGRENLLYQCAATSPVLHGEYRAGDEVRLVVKNASECFAHKNSMVCETSHYFSTGWYPT